MSAKVTPTLLYEGSGSVLALSFSKLSYPVIIPLLAGHGTACVHLNNADEVNSWLRSEIANEKTVRVYRAK